MSTQTGIDYQQIRTAYDRIHSYIRETPLIYCSDLSKQVGGKVYLKAENLQHTGSFKFRGAMNRLLQLSDSERENGVIAWSSGNHAQGVAAAASILGIHATIVMPSDAPAIKRDNTIAFGAKVVLYDRLTESREEIARAMARTSGAVVVPSFDDYDIIAGQGTTGIEISNQISEPLDQLLVCCGGGGLVTGTALALRHHFPKLEIFTVEPDGFDDTARSLLSRQRESNNNNSSSICDALLTNSPGQLTLEQLLLLSAQGICVTDEEVKTAIRYAFTKLKLVIEPGGAVALAAALHNKVQLKSRHTVLIASGGNVDPELYSKILLPENPATTV